MILRGRMRRGGRTKPQPIRRMATGGQLHSATTGRKLQTGMNETTKFQHGGNTRCTMHIGKYDCEQNGCNWNIDHCG